mmetsp:Transcript_48018/g.159123  ORF Transcript_48018/g.159123 Transcript_48018/m.159123 type:complete len:329 (+) Transcript_48018:1226-2212(+)
MSGREMLDAISSGDNLCMQKQLPKRTNHYVCYRDTNDTGSQQWYIPTGSALNWDFNDYKWDYNDQIICWSGFHRLEHTVFNSSGLLVNSLGWNECQYLDGVGSDPGRFVGGTRAGHYLGPTQSLRECINLVRSECIANERCGFDADAATGAEWFGTREYLQGISPGEDFQPGNFSCAIAEAQLLNGCVGFLSPEICYREGALMHVRDSAPICAPRPICDSGALCKEGVVTVRFSNEHIRRLCGSNCDRSGALGPPLPGTGYCDRSPPFSPLCQPHLPIPADAYCLNKYDDVNGCKACGGDADYHLDDQSMTPGSCVALAPPSGPRHNG